MSEPLAGLRRRSHEPIVTFCRQLSHARLPRRGLAIGPRQVNPREQQWHGSEFVIILLFVLQDGLREGPDGLGSPPRDESDSRPISNGYLGFRYIPSSSLSRYRHRNAIHEKRGRRFRKFTSLLSSGRIHAPVSLCFQSKCRLG
jgi:hypothetical protein